MLAPAKAIQKVKVKPAKVRHWTPLATTSVAGSLPKALADLVLTADSNIHLDMGGRFNLFEIVVQPTPMNLFPPANASRNDPRVI